MKMEKSPDQRHNLNTVLPVSSKTLV